MNKLLLATILTAISGSLIAFAPSAQAAEQLSPHQLEVQRIHQFNQHLLNTSPKERKATKGLWFPHKKKKQEPTDPNEIVFEVVHGENSTTPTVGKGQHFKAIFNQRDGRFWHFEKTPSDLVEEYPEGEPDPNDPELTWIYFTPLKDVKGEGDGIFQSTTEYDKYGNADFSKGDSATVHFVVNTK